MNIILDRFPLSTEEKVRSYFVKNNHNIAISVLTAQSMKLPSEKNTDFFFDRLISRGEPLEAMPWILSSDDLNNFAKYESLAISIFSRYNLNQKYFSQDELSLHYLLLLNFWMNKITEESIDCIFSHYLPHDPSSFVLYVLSKEKKIPYIFIDVPVVANSYKFMSCSFSERSLILHSKDDKPEDYISNMQAYINSVIENSISSIPLPLRPNALEKPERMKINERFRKFKEILFQEGVTEAIQKLINRNPLLTFFIFPFKTLNTSANTFFKVNREKYSKKSSDFNIASYSLFLKKLKLILIIRKWKYKNKSLKEIPKYKFIYFAAPAQPEATTLPAALEQRRIFVALKMLREAIPDGVRILFKENPNVFSMRNPYISGADTMKFDYYNSILNLGGIDLVDTNTNTLELIEHSIGVASINGTVPFESVIKGKVAITLAPNWYDGLDGVYRCKTVADMKKAIISMLEQKTLNLDIKDIPINKNCLIQINRNKHTPYEFNESIQNQLPKIYEATLNIFNQLGEDKWKI
jgi:hypothetical protein